MPNLLGRRNVCFTKKYLIGFLVCIFSIAVIAIVGIVTCLFTNVNCSPSDVNQTYETLCQLEADFGNIPVTVHQSPQSGMKVILAKIKGPIITGYFTLPTEAPNDDGLPHTLEHLVFLGSEKYPYNTALDQIANRCFSSGTNAWTALDHTAYTLGTGSKEGFLNVMPVFLDHILYPLLNESAFITEIYHITKEGEDAGVAYSEMQSKENLAKIRTDREMYLSMFSEPSGYRYETGGIVANMRNNLTLDKIKKYHKKFYHPENLFLIIVGDIDANDVMKALRPIEDKILSKGDRSEFEQPWRTPVPSLQYSVNREIKFPSKLENTGIVYMGWRGPSSTENVLEVQSMKILIEFLTFSSVSILQKTFVETDTPMASKVSGWVNEFAETVITLVFAGVPVNNTRDLKPLLDETLEKMVNDEVLFEMNKMRNLIKNYILKEKNKLEAKPHSTYADYIIYYILNGRDCEYLNNQINNVRWFNELLQKPREYWLNLMEMYLINGPSVVIRGIPSKSEQARLEKEKKERIDFRKRRLGVTGLRKLGEKLTESVKINESPTPNNVLESFTIPSVEETHFHQYTAYSNMENYENSTSSEIILDNGTFIDLKTLPMKMQIDDIDSQFVQFETILSANSLSSEDRLYLPLLLELILQSSIQRNRKIVSHDQVIRHLIADTIKMHTFDFKNFGPNVGISLKVAESKYEKGVLWLYDILFNLKFNADRIIVKAKQKLTSIQLDKTKGEMKLEQIFFDYIFGKESNTAGIQQQEIFLTKLLKTLESKPKKVLDKFSTIYKKITQLNSITIHMASNISVLSRKTDILAPWKRFNPATFSTTLNYSLQVRFDAKNIKPFNWFHTSGAISGLDALQTTYMQLITKGISNYSHSDLAALYVAIHFISQSQGPMYYTIRGKGLAYTTYMTLLPAEGLIKLYIKRASQPMEAYSAAVNLINKYVNETTEWETLLFEAAKSSLIYTIIEKESFIENISHQSLLAYYRNVTHTYKRDLIKKIEKVTLEDVKIAGRKYLAQLIDPKKSRLFIVCPTSELQEYKYELLMANRRLEEV